MKTVDKRKNRKCCSQAARMMMCILVFTLGFVLAQHTAAQDKPNIIIQTDPGRWDTPGGTWLGGDQDDIQSLMRFMVETNEFNVLGLIATDRGTPNTFVIHDVINAYEKAYPNLIKHADGYPTAAYLRSVTATGNDKHSPNELTEGAKLIIRQVDAATQPVWVTSWGSTTTLARALREVMATRSAAEVNAFASKIRLFESWGQCTDGAWIAVNFPNMLHLRDFGNFASHSVFDHVGEDDYDWTYAEDTWYSDNVVGKGPLGAIFPRRGFGYATDQGLPLYLLSGRYGLSDPEQHTWGGWGGRFNSRKTRWPGTLGNYHERSGAYIPHTTPWVYTLAHDTYAGYNNWYITTARWRQAAANDYAARMNWTVASRYSDANHPPVARVDGSLRRTVTSGAVVNLSAAGSTDPDGDPLMYKWWHYPEPGTYKRTLAISNANSRDASFVAPDVSSTQTIHIILEVTDTGTPPLTRYQRMIVTVNPGSNPPALNPEPVIYDAPWTFHTYPQPSTPGNSKRVHTFQVVAGYEDRSANPGEFTYTWRQVSGEGTVSFDSTNGTASGNIVTATMPAPTSTAYRTPKYGFNVTVSNGTRSVTAPLTVVVWNMSPMPIPGRPGGLTVTAASSSHINLSWTNVSGNYGYKISRRLGTDGEWTLIGRVAQNVTSYTDNVLASGTTYFYNVVTIGALMSSFPSDIRSATTQGTRVAVYAPSNLSASASGSSQINLSWRDNSGNESGFRIERKTGSGGNWSQIATVGANVTGYADTVLSAGTYYYRVRAYNSNANSAYSNEAINTTSSYDSSRSSFTDSRDGNVYKTVTIGNQVWMVENLAYEPGSGNYWAYDNNSSNVAKYGYLYDWQTALNVCPTGWHLPSDAEWTELADYLGGVSIAGGKLKATGTIEAGTGLWRNSNTGATNETGFTALPGGARYYCGTFGGIGGGGTWWSATEFLAYYALYRGVSYNYSGVGRYYSDQEDGFSVRCVRD